MRAMASPIPEVPPTKMATGLGEVRWPTMALDARTVKIGGMAIWKSESWFNGSNYKHGIGHRWARVRPAGTYAPSRARRRRKQRQYLK